MPPKTMFASLAALMAAGCASYDAPMPVQPADARNSVSQPAVPLSAATALHPAAAASANLPDTLPVPSPANRSAESYPVAPQPEPAVKKCPARKPNCR